MKRDTYSAGGAPSFINPLGGTGIWFTIANPVPSTRQILISRIIVGIPDVNLTFLMAKRSSLSTGGTPFVLSDTPHSSKSPPLSALLRIYTVPPTVAGALIGFLRIFVSDKLGDGQAETIYKFDDDENLGIILLPGEEVSLETTFVGAVTWSAAVQWQEEG